MRADPTQWRGSASDRSTFGADDEGDDRPVAVGTAAGLVSEGLPTWADRAVGKRIGAGYRDVRQFAFEPHSPSDRLLATRAIDRRGLIRFFVGDAFGGFVGDVVRQA